MAHSLHHNTYSNDKAIMMRCTLPKYLSRPFLSPSARACQSQSGFTLIEMMIVVAIIGILAATIVFNYQIQLRKTQIMTIYQETNRFRLPYQILTDDGAGVIDFSPSGLNMPVQTKYCQFTVIAPNANGATPNAVTCTIQNLSYLQGQSLSLDRAANDSWQCRPSAGIPKAYLPKECQ